MNRYNKYFLENLILGKKQCIQVKPSGNFISQKGEKLLLQTHQAHPSESESCMNEPMHTQVKKHTRQTRVHQSTPTTLEHNRMCISTSENARAGTSHCSCEFLFWLHTSLTVELIHTHLSNKKPDSC
jgi:hypothetical protein